MIEVNKISYLITELPFVRKDKADFLGMSAPNAGHMGYTGMNGKI